MCRNKGQTLKAGTLQQRSFYKDPVTWVIQFHTWQPLETYGNCVCTVTKEMSPIYPLVRKIQAIHVLREFMESHYAVVY